jgi:hypothetical protein
MRRIFIAVALLTAAIPAVSAIAKAGIFRNPCCCHMCQAPCGTCSCQATYAAPQTTYQPVMDTQYVQQPTTTYRDVVETQYRTEAYNETVPTVSYQNVTQDEGAYQTVWVPRPVTRQVARTTYQTRTGYRQVPYQVSRRVAEQTMQTVPVTSMRYIPQTTMSTCNTCNSGIASAPIMGSGVPYTAAVAPYVQSAQLNHNHGTAPTAISSNSFGPVPDARFSAAAPTPVAPRMASTDESSWTPVTPVTPEARTASAGPSLFVPAPSAAQVWRTPRNTTIR